MVPYPHHLPDCPPAWLIAFQIEEPIRRAPDPGAGFGRMARIRRGTPGL